MEDEVEKQEAMAFLRERYLFLLSNLCCKGGAHCEIQMYENTKVECNIKAFDLDFQNVIVENLQTPVPPGLDKAILRTGDIISMKFNCNLLDLVNK